MSETSEIVVEAVARDGQLQHLEVNARHSPRGVLVKIDRGGGPNGGAGFAYVRPGKRAKVHLDGRLEPEQIGLEEFIELGGEG